MDKSFEKAQAKLKEVWGYDSFRAGQDEVVRSVLEGKDTLVLFPTGGGKSICYQVPALVFDGLTVVISPLIALMQDQVKQLKDKGIPATFINSTLSYREVEQRLVNARNGMYKLLYCAPERLKTDLWQAELNALPVELVAIDEAHCISEWGHDFRPSYRDIKSAMEPVADKVRWLALTATATPEVKKDILENLQLKEPKIISRGFQRPNLKWWVVRTGQKKKKLINATLKASKKGDGLIYGGTRRNCEDLASMFTSKALKAEAYHAGVASDKRKAIQERWIKGETPLVVATNAFGMGIDKPDCRYVIHETMPYSLEAYYQEAGRAGRDGEDAYPILFYREADYHTAEKRLTDKYPVREELEHAYQVICDSLNLAVGSEMEEMTSFETDMITRRGKLSRPKALASLRILDQLEVITLVDDVPAAVSLQFTLSASGLKTFKSQVDNNEKAEFIDKLERLFGSFSYHEPVELNEEHVLKHLNISRNQLVKGLNVLMQHDQVLVYTLLKTRSLIRVNEARSSKLPLSTRRVEDHRKVVFEKLEYMHGYILTDECREVYLRNYFGDTNAKACGTCDNCKSADAESNDELRNEWLKQVVSGLRSGKETVNELSREFDLSKERVAKVLKFLIREGKVVNDPAKPEAYQLSED
ncbi:ATP-dependent DNA helicase RecQ [Balneola sp. MJW-20]|uniref:RecQ family ATP-dependent DNA helicase n=1 Tax=Gracilimonas aurantiaca TaxID=3234185 RepID=UPI0034673AB1